MPPTNGPASSMISVCQRDSGPSGWEWIKQLLIRWRVRLTAILLSILIVEDLLEGIRPRSLFDFQNAFSMLGVVLVVSGVALRSWAAGTLHKITQLTTCGPYGVLRHPLYVGSLMTMLGICTLINDEENIWFVVGPILALYVFRAIQEERYMARRYPTQWHEYARQVPRFLPRRWPNDAFAFWSWDLWLRNREYRMVGAVSLGLIAMQMWYLLR
ncbi:MAG: isoprenylcysteine carboxylmethyltransferase family protein [Pirellulales bacterium]